jgi:quinol monooxygenase YgiN
MLKMSNQNETQITVHVIAKSKAGKENKLKRLFKSILEPARKESGCIDYILHQDPKDPTHFMFYENWENQAALDAHLITSHMLSFLQEVTDLIEKPVEIFSWQIINY